MAIQRTQIMPNPVITGGPVPAMDPRGIVPVARTQPLGVQHIPERLGSLPPAQMATDGIVPVSRPGAALPPNFRGEVRDPSFEGLQRATMAQELGPRARAAAQAMQAAAADQQARAQRLGRSGLRAALASRMSALHQPHPSRVGGLLKTY